jgi:hypothetical protein
MNRPISRARTALFGAGIALLIVVLALVGLARLTPGEPAPSARVPAPPSELTVGTVVFDTAAVASERRNDIVGALLMFFAVGGALCALSFTVWGFVLARRAARAAPVETGAGKREDTAPQRGLAR